MRSISSPVLLCALALVLGSRAPASGSALVTPVARDSRSITKELLHDASSMGGSAQDGEGRVWGVRYTGGAGVFHWTEDAWRLVEDAADWPGNVFDLAAEPTDPAAVVSVWAGRPDTGSDLSVLHVRRHRAGEPSVLLASFPNPSAGYGDSNGRMPRLAVGPGGEVWLTFPAPVLVCVPARGGEPSFLRPDPGLFTPVEGKRITSYKELAFLPVGPGEGWWWTLREEPRPHHGGGELVRPARVRAGRIEPCPPISGLPAAGRVTLVADRAANGRMVWAIENGGLWEVDSAALTATSLISPIGAWRIIDWAEPAAGLETALVIAEKKNATRRVGDIWIRKTGAWMNAGASGDVQVRSDINDGWQLRPRSWVVDGEILLAGGFSGGLPAIDLTEPEPRVRSLGPAERQSVERPARVHRLRDGAVLTVGIGTLRAAPGALGRAVREAEARAPMPYAFKENPVRAPDGRIWVSRPRVGPPEVRHWDGATWRRWVMPTEQVSWPDTTLWVDERGRVALFTGDLSKPAYERDESTASGWRAWPDARDLVAARAAETPPSAAWVRFDEGARYTPVFSGDGRALVSVPEIGTLWYYADGVWTSFEQRQIGTPPTYYGFEPDEGGAPWCQSYSERRRLIGGRWEEAPAVPEIGDDYEPPSGTHQRPPRWVNALLADRSRGSLQADSDGVWWALVENELWKLRDGDAVQVFADDEPSPFRTGVGGRIDAVHVDAKGHRFFQGQPHVLLPARPGPVAEVVPLPAGTPYDRVFTVGGDGLVKFEWRINAGPWRKGAANRIELNELPAGVATLEVRGVNHRLDLGPIARLDLRLDYDAEARTAKLIVALHSPEPAARADAIRRLARRGATAEAVLRQAMDSESDDDRRWWLRAALQAIADETARYRLDDICLTNP